MRMFFLGLGLFVSACVPIEDGLKDSAQEDEVVDPACVDHRTGYPSGPYGYSVGSILEDFPGMVDGSGTAQSLTALHQDTSKTVLVIANAFDT
ncbi:MAG: hypothetical protein CMK59_10685 [Proteobacteria bacterium]|nr:hypothetical protein [Pseudomonadota bacterium]